MPASSEKIQPANMFWITAKNEQVGGSNKIVFERDTQPINQDALNITRSNRAFGNKIAVVSPIDFIDKYNQLLSTMKAAVPDRDTFRDLFNDIKNQSYIGKPIKQTVLSILNFIDRVCLEKGFDANKTYFKQGYVVDKSANLFYSNPKRLEELKSFMPVWALPIQKLDEDGEMFFGAPSNKNPDRSDILPDTMICRMILPGKTSEYSHEEIYLKENIPHEEDKPVSYSLCLRRYLNSGIQGQTHSQEFDFGIASTKRVPLTEDDLIVESINFN